MVLSIGIGGQWSEGSSQIGQFSLLGWSASARSAREHKAWGGAKRNSRVQGQIIHQPAKRATDLKPLSQSH